MKRFFILTEDITGPTEWSDEDETIRTPAAVFDDPEKLRQWLRAKQKEDSTRSFNLYEIKWHKSKKDPTVSQWYEGLPT